MVTIGLHSPQSFYANSREGAAKCPAVVTLVIELGLGKGDATIFIRNLQQAKDLAAAANHAVQLAEEAFKEATGV